MSQAYTGGCACGAIRYTIDGEPVFMNDCQGRRCQRKSGTGHGSYLPFPRAGGRGGGGPASDGDGGSGGAKPPGS